MDRATRRDLVRDIVNQVDPIGFLAGGAPSDEYQIEIAAIERRVEPGASVTEIGDLLDEILLDSFGDMWSRAGDEKRDALARGLADQLG